MSETGTIGAIRRSMASRLKAASPSAALDSMLLMGYVLGLEPGQPQPDEARLDEKKIAALAALVARRAAGEPVARIVGEKEFYGLAIKLGPETLVPRADTETLVSEVLRFVDDGTGRDAPIRILDLGTGSGAILIALLANLPAASGLGIDLSAAAVEVARANAQRHGLGTRALFRAGNWSDAIPSQFDVVVSNPPYIASEEIETLAPEVRVYDPRLALDGGRDGLEAFRDIFARLDKFVAAEGAAFIEIGAGQEEAVAGLARQAGFRASFAPDLAGILRVAHLRRAAGRGRG